MSGTRRALFPVCGDTLFSLPHQGREFLPAEFTGIDRMTASGGGQDLYWVGFRCHVEVILAPCQKPVVSQFKFQQWVGRGRRVNDASPPGADIRSSPALSIISPNWPETSATVQYIGERVRCHLDCRRAHDRQRGSSAAILILSTHLPCQERELWARNLPITMIFTRLA
jgi:hypothetical protein